MCVAAYRTSEFPAFFTETSGCKVVKCKTALCLLDPYTFLMPGDNLPKAKEKLARSSTRRVQSRQLSSAPINAIDFERARVRVCLTVLTMAEIKKFGS